MGLRILGVYSLLKGFPPLMQVILEMRVWKEYMGLFSTSRTDGLLSSVIYVLVGLYLLFEGKWLIRATYKEKERT